MASHANHHDNTRSSTFSSLPPAYRQLTFAATGALAGACTIPIEVLGHHSSPSSSRPLSSRIRTLTTYGPLVYRAAVRFWIFDITKCQLNHPTLSAWFKGGLSGAAGGFAEVCAHSLVHRKVPTATNLAVQSAKLFMCFGSYTWLSTTLSPDQLPPKPFWYCWLMGGAAGGLGSGIIARLEGVKGRALLSGPVLKGVTAIGTVIAVQVTSSAKVLESLEG